MTNNQPIPPSNREPQNSEHHNLESVLAELRNLKDENSRLKKIINDLDTIEELLVYRVADQSMNKIVTYAVGITTLVAGLLAMLFGEGIINSLANNYIESEDFKNKIAEETAQIIIQKPELLKEIADKVASSPILGEQQQLKIEGQVDAQLAQVAKRVEETNPQVAEAIQPSSISEPVYFVVAGSSPKKSDLESELGRVKKLLGDDSLFAPRGRYLEKICPPKEENRFFALVIAENKTLRDASDIVEQAKQDGFRQDTYPLPSDKAFFKCPS